jgi:hypothetical protein
MPKLIFSVLDILIMNADCSRMEYRALEKERSGLAIHEKESTPNYALTTADGTSDDPCDGIPGMVDGRFNWQQIRRHAVPGTTSADIRRALRRARRTSRGF